MKNINIYLEDQEYERLVANKGEMTWREFVMTLAAPEKE